jgi:hypothetical protein
MTTNNGSAPASKRVVFSCGGKGGTGKTTFISSLAEWYDSHGLKYRLLDLDVENKLHGSLKHFHPQAEKVNPTGERGLDVFLSILFSDLDILVADQGASQGQLTFEWFDTVYSQAVQLGYPIQFTAVGLLTYDPSSLESVLTWAEHLQDRVKYLLIKNHVRARNGNSYTDNFSLETKAAQDFVQAFRPSFAEMPLRVSDLEVLLRRKGVTLGAVADGKAGAELAGDPGLRFRASYYRNQIYNALNEVQDILKPY